MGRALTKRYAVIDQLIGRMQNSMAAAIQRLPPAAFAAAFGITVVHTWSGISRLHPVTVAAIVGQLFTSIEIFISALIGAGSAALTIDWCRRWVEYKSVRCNLREVRPHQLPRRII